jgi:hypothetical protein
MTPTQYAQANQRSKQMERDSNSTFTALTLEATYDIIDGETGHFLTQGIRGCDAMAAKWPNGAEAYPAGDVDVSELVEVAA